MSRLNVSLADERRVKTMLRPAQLVRFDETDAVEVGLRAAVGLWYENDAHRGNRPNVIRARRLDGIRL